MRIARIEFVTAVHVPGRPQRHTQVIADADLNVTLEEGFVRMVSGAVTVLAPLSNVAWIFPSEDQTPTTPSKKRSSK